MPGRDAAQPGGSRRHAHFLGRVRVAYRVCNHEIRNSGETSEMRSAPNPGLLRNSRLERRRLPPQVCETSGLEWPERGHLQPYRGEQLVGSSAPKAVLR